MRLEELELLHSLRRGEPVEAAVIEARGPRRRGSTAAARVLWVQVVTALA
jgi:hypothetical protein